MGPSMEPDQPQRSPERAGGIANLQRLYDLVPVAEEIDIVEDVEEHRLRVLAREILGAEEPVAEDPTCDLVAWLAEAFGATVIADYRIDD